LLNEKSRRGAHHRRGHAGAAQLIVPPGDLVQLTGGFVVRVQNLRLWLGGEQGGSRAGEQGNDIVSRRYQIGLHYVVEQRGTFGTISGNDVVARIRGPHAVGGPTVIT